MASIFPSDPSAVLLCVGLVPGRPSPHAPPVQANPPLQITISAGDFSVPARAHYGAPVTCMGLVSQATWIEIEAADITWRRETMLSRDTLDNHHPTLARSTPQETRCPTGSELPIDRDSPALIRE